MSLSPGSRLGPYQILGALGAGGMGEVYKARDTRLDRTVAVKILSTHLSSNPDSRARFEREARAASALNHPHICALHDVGQHEGIDFLVLEYLEGETLADRLTRGPLPIAQVLGFGIEIAESLAAAHKAGIVHRDLKPGNVMLTKAGAKLMDFGLAKLRAISEGGDEGKGALSAAQTASAAKPLTSVGAVMGTFRYMSPEQLEGKEADARADIWALGALLYEMATGERAFAGGSQASVVAAILKDEPRPMRDVGPLMPPALDRLVRACLAKDPDERMQSARDVARELRWIRTSSEAPVEGEVGVPGSRRAQGRESLLWGLVVTVSVLAALWAAGRWLPKGWREARDVSTPVTRSVIELPASAALGFGAAADGVTSNLLALSPDGKLLVYVGTSGGVTRLYRRALDRFDDPQPIAGTEGALHAFFSPDGRSLGFLTDDKVKRVSVEGDDLRTLCAAQQPAHGSWTRTDTIYYADGQGMALARVAARGGHPETLEPDLPHEHWNYFGDALPNGKAVLMTERRSASGDYDAILAFDVETRKSRVLVDFGYDPRFVSSGHLLFARGGNIMAVALDPDRLVIQGEPVAVLQGVAMNSVDGHAQVAISATGSVAFVPGGDRAIGRLARVDRKGHTEVLPARPERYGALELSPDGTHLAVHVADVNDYIWIWDLRRSEGRRMTGPSPAGWPVWSPTGELVAFTSWGLDSTPPAIQVQRVDGGEAPHTLLQGTGSALRLFVAFSWATTKLSVGDGWLRSGILSTTGQLPVEWDEALCVFGAISRDGHWMAFFRGGQVYIRSLTERTVVRQVSTEGGIEPRWCKGCNDLFFRTKGDRWLATSVSFEPALRWDAPRLVFETDFLDSVGYSYDVSPDGQYLYVVKPAASDERRRVHLVTGWFEELRKLVPSAR